MSLLSPYRVLDLTDERGMLAGRMLADLGADVVQVEPPGGSSARQRAPRDDAHGSFFFGTYAANKRGMVLDLDTTAGQSRLKRLAVSADFLIESAEPGLMAARKIDWPDLREINPSLVYVSITAFGRTGPKANYAASDLTVWAAGGPLDPHRDAERPPVRISVPQAFLHAGADAAAGALLAHHARIHSGRGQHVDVSAQSSLGIATLAQILADAVGDDKPRFDQRFKTRAMNGPNGESLPAPQKKWQCRDGLVEFQFGIGAAAGPFTRAFVLWMVDEKAAGREWLEIDWATLPQAIEAGRFPIARLAQIYELVGDFLATKTKDQVLAAATQRKLLCVPIYDTSDVAESTQLAARDYWIETAHPSSSRHLRLPGRYAKLVPDGFSFTRPAPLLDEHAEEVVAEWLGTERALPRRSPPLAPLEGIRVLDLSWVVAGPLSSRAMADFGAVVVRVESSTRLDSARHMPPFYEGVVGIENSALYGTCNAGKYGVTVDLGTDAGRRVVRELAAQSDVVIESYSPGQMAKWGLDYESLRRDHPELVMVSTSLLGQSGPYSRLAGYGTVGAALSGFQDIAGWPDRPVLGPFGPYTDFIGPRMALVALLAALDHCRRTGAGCYIDVAQVEAGVYFQSPELAAYFATGAISSRMGNQDREFAPHGVYSCLPENGKDRFVAIAVTNDAEWQHLCAALERPDLGASPELSTRQQRRRRADELDSIVSAWSSTQLVSQVVAILQAARVPAHASASSQDLHHDPQLRHRGYFRTVTHPTHGEVIVEGARYHLSETPAVVRRAAPTLGQDNEHIIQTLGYDEEQYTSLVENGVLQ